MPLVIHEYELIQAASAARAISAEIARDNLDHHTLSELRGTLKALADDVSAARADVPAINHVLLYVVRLSVSRFRPVDHPRQTPEANPPDARRIGRVIYCASEFL